MHLYQQFRSYVIAREWPILVVLLSLLFAVFIFKEFLFHPNDLSFSYGGDAFAIYYDMVYHVAHDRGTMFHGMGYPDGEYIFLTDAQGSVSTVLQWIHHNIMPVGDYVVGVVHSLNLYLLPACSLFLFFIFRYFHVKEGIACIFSILLTFLSPQMLRVGSHFGLAYPFLIPMVMWWFLRKWKNHRIDWIDGLVFLTLLFFTFNNPYVGFAACGFLMAAGFLVILFYYRQWHYLIKGILIAGVGFVANLIPYLVFNLNDPFDDRLKQQWGFFYYHADLQGLFFPPHSFVFDLLQLFQVSVKDLEVERWINLGIVSIILFIGIVITIISRLLRKINFHHFPVFKKENLLLFSASFLLFLYAANSSVLPLNVDWMEKHLGTLLMFKASARIAWPIYFAIGISAVIYLDWLLRRISNITIAWAISVVLALTWLQEIKSYIGRRYVDTFHANFLHRDKSEEIISLLDEHGINTEQYQAILAVPNMVAWNDQFITDINWATQFFSMRLSAATGLPLISAMHSRISNKQCTEAIQMLSDPLIERELVTRLNPGKDILVLVGSNYPSLKKGEQHVIDLSTPLFSSNDFSLYQLPVDSLIHSSTIIKAKSTFASLQPDTNGLIRFDFDSIPGSVTFYGKGARKLEKGQAVLVQQPFPASSDSQFVFSAWTHFDDKKPSVGNWYVSVIDSTGKASFETHIETRRSHDIQGHWVRSELLLPVPPKSSVWVMLETNRDFIVDEILIYPASSKIIIDHPDDSTFLYNGFRIRKN